MTQNKTTETQHSVPDFLTTIKDEKRREDISTIIGLITKQTGFEAKMWGTSIVGFGSYHYKYESGREGDAPLSGIASRTNGIALYLSSEFKGRSELLSRFGKHKTGKGCVYIQTIEDIDTNILTQMVENSMIYYRDKYPS